MGNTLSTVLPPPTPPGGLDVHAATHNRGRVGDVNMRQQNKKNILTQAGEIVERQCKNVRKYDDRGGVLFYGYRGKGWLLFTCALVDVLEVARSLC